MIPETEPNIKRNDSTPSIIEQAKLSGWEAGMYNFGKAESGEVTYFNPGLVRCADGLWMLVRRSENVQGSPFGMNSVWAIKLDKSGIVPVSGTRLRWTDEQEGQQFEDARVFPVEHMGQVGVSACTFKWHGDNSWTGAIQVLGFFDNEWNCKVTHYVPFDSNSTSLQNIPRERYQKNWLFWMRDNRLHLIYKSDPWTIVEFGDGWSHQRTHINAGAKWEFGEARGGTPPVLVGNRYYTFFHSSVAWRGNYRRYYMGAIAFAPEPPFEITEVTKEPLLIGSQQDEWQQRKPLCVFPCGSNYEKDQWLITLGVNDLRAAWLRIPHESLLNRFGLNAPSVIAVNPTPVNTLSERCRAALTKARAVKAAKTAKRKARQSKKSLAATAA